MASTSLDNLPSGTSSTNDTVPFTDIDDSNKTKKDTLGGIVSAGLPGANTDLLPEGSVNKYVSASEKEKLGRVEDGAEVNQVNSVNGLQGPVSLTQDEVPSGATYSQTENNFSDTYKQAADDSILHILDTDNPHQVTKEQVGLGSVLDEEQLSKEDGSFSSLVDHGSLLLHPDTMWVVQDKRPGSLDKISSVRASDMVRLVGSKIRERSSSTSYSFYPDNGNGECSDVVIYQGTLFRATSDHISSPSFGTDLSGGLWSPLATGAGTSVTVTVAGGAPTAEGLVVGDMYIDTTTDTLYYWDGASWVQLTNTDTGGVSFEEAVTTGDKLTKSVGTGADAITETGISVDANDNVTGVNSLTVEELTVNTSTNLSGTITHNNTTQTGDTTYDSNSSTTYNNSQITYTGTENQISCVATPSFGTAYSRATDTQRVRVNITFDNGVDGADNQVYDLAADGGPATLSFVSGSDEGSISLTRSTDFTVAIESGTAGFFTLNSVCRYNGFTQVNNTGIVENNTNNIVNNTNINETNVGGTVVNENVDVTYEGGTQTFQNIEITESISLVGGAISFSASSTETVPDSNILASSTIARSTDSEPAGFIEVTSIAGSITATSTTSETLTLNYKIL